jgi:hypothetical protein
MVRGWESEEDGEMERGQQMTATASARAPDATVPIELLLHAKAGSGIRVIRTDVFPSDVGVYVLKRAQRPIPRLRGESPILKIGSTVKGFRSRFDEYNHQRDVTRVPPRLFTEYMDRRQRSNAHFLYFLAHWREPEHPIVADLYFSADPRSLEYEFLSEYFLVHGEYPPLNTGHS